MKQLKNSKNRNRIFHYLRTRLQRSYLEALHKCFFVVTTDKSESKLTVISKIYYISKFLAELGISNSKSKTNSKATYSIEKVIPGNIKLLLKV